MCWQLNNRDPVNSSVLAKAAVINPEILPLATGTGFQVDQYFSRMIFQTIWNKEGWTPEDKASEIEVRFLNWYRPILHYEQELCSLCPQLSIDANYVLLHLGKLFFWLIE